MRGTNRRSGSLTVRIVAITLLAVLLPAAGLVASSLYLGRAVTQDIDRQAETTLDLAIQLHQATIAGRLRDLGATAATLTMDDRFAAILTNTTPPGPMEQSLLSAVGQQLQAQADIFLLVDTNGQVRWRYRGSAGDQVSYGGLVKSVLSKGERVTSPARIPAQELSRESQDLRDQVILKVTQTAGAEHELVGKELTDALALTAGAPVRNGYGQVVGAILLADVLNNDPTIVDEVQALSPEGIPLTATIAMDGIRVTTNVRKKGTDERATGTLYSDAVMAKIRSGEPFRGRALVGGYEWQKTIYTPLTDLSGQVIASPYVGIRESHFTQIGETFTLVTRIGLAIGVLALLLGALLPWWLANRQVRRPLLSFVAALEAGDLTTTFTSTARDEVGLMAGALNDLLGKVRQSIRQVTEAADQAATLGQELLDVTTSTTARAAETTALTEAGAGIARKLDQQSQETNAGMSDLSQTATEIARGAEEQAAHLDRVTAMVHQIDQSQRESLTEGEAALAAAQKTFRLVRDGEQAIAATLAGIQRIGANAADSVILVEQLGETSREISQISGVIAGIADQTNLLALNAAIEAARAGEQGRGFAVVAEEVRALAERAGKSTHEIERLIQTTLGLITQTVEAIRLGQRYAQDGEVTGVQAQTTLGEILKASRTSADSVEQIVHVAIAANVDRMRQITEAMQSVAAVVEENTAGAEEMASTTEVASGNVQLMAGGVAEIASGLTRIQQEMRGMEQQHADLRRVAERLNQVSGDLVQATRAFRA